MVDGLQQEYADRMQFSVYKDSSSTEQINQFAFEQGVQYVPTMMLVSPTGVELERWIGTTSAETLKAAFDGNME